MQTIAGVLTTDKGVRIAFRLGPGFDHPKIYILGSDEKLSDAEAKAFVDVARRLVDESNKIRQDGRKVEITITCNPEKEYRKGK